MKRPSFVGYKSDCLPNSFPYASKQGILLLILFFFFPAIPLSAADGDPHNDQYSSGIDPSVGVVIVVLFCAFFTTGCIATYIRGCADAGAFSAPPPYGRFILPVVSGNRRASSGLDRSEIESFPTFVYADVKEMKVGKRALECAVCLTEFDDEDTLRLLPRCEHAFHPECIDAWLAVRSTCPVCRSDLLSVANEIRAGGIELAAPPRRLSGERDGSESSDDEEAHPSVAKPNPNPAVKLARSNSTGHSLEEDRYRLRLPEKVRRQMLVEAKMRRAKSYEALPRVPSSRKGYRISGEEGSNSRSGKLLRWTGLVKSAGDGEAAAGTSSGAILVAIVVG